MPDNNSFNELAYTHRFIIPPDPPGSRLTALGAGDGEVPALMTNLQTRTVIMQHFSFRDFAKGVLVKMDDTTTVRLDTFAEVSTGVMITVLNSIAGLLERLGDSGVRAVNDIVRGRDVTSAVSALDRVQVTKNELEKAVLTHNKGDLQSMTEVESKRLQHVKAYHKFTSSVLSIPASGSNMSSVDIPVLVSEDSTWRYQDERRTSLTRVADMLRNKPSFIRGVVYRSCYEGDSPHTSSAQRTLKHNSCRRLQTALEAYAGRVPEGGAAVLIANTLGCEIRMTPGPY